MQWRNRNELLYRFGHTAQIIGKCIRQHTQQHKTFPRIVDIFDAIKKEIAVTPNVVKAQINKAKFYFGDSCGEKQYAQLWSTCLIANQFAQQNVIFKNDKGGAQCVFRAMGTDFESMCLPKSAKDIDTEHSFVLGWILEGDNAVFSFCLVKQLPMSGNTTFHINLLNQKTFIGRWSKSFSQQLHGVWYLTRGSIFSDNSLTKMSITISEPNLDFQMTHVRPHPSPGLYKHNTIGRVEKSDLQDIKLQWKQIGHRSFYLKPANKNAQKRPPGAPPMDTLVGYQVAFSNPQSPNTPTPWLFSRFKKTFGYGPFQLVWCREAVMLAVLSCHPQKRHFAVLTHECLATHLYFDIDKERKNYVRDEEYTSDDGDRVCAALLHWLQRAGQKYIPNWPTQLDPWVYSATNGKKLSYHLDFVDIMFRGIRDVGCFVARMLEDIIADEHSIRTANSEVSGVVSGAKSASELLYIHDALDNKNCLIDISVYNARRRQYKMSLCCKPGKTVMGVRRVPSYVAQMQLSPFESKLAALLNSWPSTPAWHEVPRVLVFTNAKERRKRDKHTRPRFKKIDTKAIQSLPSHQVTHWWEAISHFLCEHHELDAETSEQVRGASVSERGPGRWSWKMPHGSLCLLRKRHHTSAGNVNFGTITFTPDGRCKWDLRCFSKQSCHSEYRYGFIPQPLIGALGELYKTGTQTGVKDKKSPDAQSKRKAPPREAGRVRAKRKKQAKSIIGGLEYVF